MMQDKAMEAFEEQVAAQASGQNGVGETVETPAATEAVPSADAQLMEQLKSEVAAAQARADELTDKLQRTAADFQNSRRRQERQLAEEIERASSHLLRRLLPIIDDFQLAFANLPPGADESQVAWVEGFRQIQKKLNGLLEDEGVTLVPADGPFDPTKHEAVISEAHETIPSGHIIQTLRTGYEYKGRVLRPALVRVAA
jgi:molecular chaperone GrpE